MNSVIVEPTENSIIVEIIDVLTIYYWIQPTQLVPEHWEVTG